MADTFTFVPTRGFNNTIKPRVRTAQFGDGYAQRIGEGINTVTKEWNLTFASRELSEIALILDFLETKAGVTAFLWTPPGESTAIAVICQDWSKVYESHISATVQAKFTKVHEVLA